MGKDQELIEAARNGHIAVVSKIVDHISRRVGPLSSFRRSPSINCQDMNGYTPLHHACLNGHADVVRLLLANESVPDMPDIRGSTPLYLAAWAGHQEIVKMLLLHPTKPANPNVQTIDNETPLHCAAQHGHNTVLAILLAYGAMPNIRNDSFQTALDLAAQFGRLQAVQILIRTHPELLDPYKSVNEAASEQSSYQTPPFFNTGTRHIFTHTCLHLASRNGHKKVVETLLEAGVDVNIMTHAGTALHEAALCGKKSVAALLLQAGVNPYATDGNGRTALDLLKDFPPHVTYDIVSVINDFCNRAENMNMNRNYFRPIVETPIMDENENLDEYSTNNESDVSEQSEKLLLNFNNDDTNSDNIVKIVTPEPRKATNFHIENQKHRSTTNGYSTSKISLEQPAKPKQIEPYLMMKPIISQDGLPTYKPVYKRLCFNYGKEDVEKFEKTASNESSSSANGDGRAGNRVDYHCVDEYVKMSTPASSNASTPRTPLPTPRKLESADYVNLDILKAVKSIPETQQQDQNVENTFTTTTSAHCSPPREAKISNIYNNSRSHKVQTHSPTPEFPPPTVLEAENTILEYMLPLNNKSKRRSLKYLSDDDFQEFKSFSFEYINTRQEKSPELITSPPLTDCVEKFSFEKHNPFAGLFKGSTINLSNNVDGDEEHLSDHSSPLRSPSLVRSIKPIPPKRNLKNSASNVENFNELKEWKEIDTILESIGNEVLNADLTINSNTHDNNKNKSKNKKAIRKSEAVKNKTETVKLRDPSDLIIGAANPKSNTMKNWCQSTSTLVHGQIFYYVYYLGSTVIRKLYGTESTRKSIQKFKAEDNVSADQEQEESLLDNCNTSTKYLKANNLQTRSKVGIGISHVGVKFIDVEKKTTFCLHDIKNINCVCQDAEDMRYFAYLTKEDDLYYCHVFMVDRLELATEIILTLAQAFEVAYQLTINSQNKNFNTN